MKSFSKLSKYWPTLKPVKTNEEFWEHEFIKHGTCSNMAKDQEKYFETTLEIRDRLYLEEIS